MPRTKKKRIVYRDSIDGRFISKEQARRRPATTQRQTVVVNAPKRQTTPC